MNKDSEDSETAMERVERIYENIRLPIVAHLPIKKREPVLKDIYGENWRAAGAYPREESYENIQKVLHEWTPQDHPLVIEEYRRLESSLPYIRKLLCVDLEGVLSINNQAPKGMKDAL